MKTKALLSLLFVGALVASCNKDDGDQHNTGSKTYTVTVNADASRGTATASKTTANVGEKITLNAHPKTGYVFDEWTASGGVTVDKEANPATFTMPAANVSVTAVFVVDPNDEPGDKTELNAEIAVVAELNAADYTAASWAALLVALEDAEEVADSANATDAMIAEALAALQEAADNLEPVATQDELDTAIGTVDELDETHYTAESWDALQDALAAAEAVAANADATPSQIQEALDALEEAIGNLEATASKAGLNAIISAVADLKETTYTAASWAAVESALSAAQTVAADDNATEAEIAAAIADLEDALKNLELKPVAANKTTLDARITVANSYKEADYTPATWATFESALTEAKQIQANATATQTQVDAAVVALNKAMNNLQHVTVSADKTQLNAFIADADELVQADYTAESWAPFAQALADAKTVSANASATQDDVQKAYEDLQNAQANLVLDTQTDTGLVRELITQLASEIDQLNALLALPIVGQLTAPTLATTADLLRDQINGLLGGVDNALMEPLNAALDAILIDLGLDNLI